MKNARILEILRAASVANLVSSYGTTYFVAGQVGVDYAASGATAEFGRNSLDAAVALGVLSRSPGLSGRGEYGLSPRGRALLKLAGKELLTALRTLRMANQAN